MDSQSATPEPAKASRARQSSPRLSQKAKACAPCRQQKVKCDALSRPSKLCTRCLAAGMPCYFSTNFERKKARSKAEMQREILMLRSQLSNSQTQVTKSSASSHDDEHEERLDMVPIPAVQTHQCTPNVRSTTIPCDPPLDNFYTSTTLPPSTTTRTIDGICVEGFKIRDCFSLFFRHYHPMLPILDPSWDPESFYKLSPFVFWCLLITGARRYELDPTILDRLAPSVKQLSLKALSQVTAYFPSICGLLILCAWPLPMNTMSEDLSPVYSGAAMHLALQHGLHMFTKQHASARPTAFRGIDHEASLARVWAYLEFVCHCTSWTTGSPPHSLTDAFDLLPHDHDLTKSIPPSIFWMQEFEKVCTRATMTLTEMTASNSTKNYFRGTIKLFDDQILDISQKAVEDMQLKMSGLPGALRPGGSLLPNPMIISICRIYINAFHFFASDVSAHFADLIELYHSACQWAQQISETDEINDWALYSSESYFRFEVLAATIILRISQSDKLKSNVDLEFGERAYFSIVKLIKKRSLQTRDVNAHTAAALSELWHSNDCFRLPDGSHDSLKVCFSGRGVMAVAYECLWAQLYERRGAQQPPEEPSVQQSTHEVSTMLPILDTGIENNSLMEMPLGAENYFPDLTNDTSLSFLYDINMQWTQDDYFWA